MKDGFRYKRTEPGVIFNLNHIVNYVTPGYATAVFVTATGVERIRTTAESHRRIAIIEVKGRHGLGFGIPAEAVTAEKQRRIFRAAEAYLQRERPERASCRFDVVSILEEGSTPRVNILRGAFEGPVQPRLRR